MNKRKFASFLPPKPDRSLGGDSLPSAWNRSSTTPKKAVPLVDLADEDVELSEKQDLFFELISQGQSVFITGAAGTGKSYVLKILQDVMGRLHRADKIFITASTGVAACNIGGLTIHSWSGIGTGAEPLEELFARVNRSREAKRNWKKADILVIDEISILSSDMFDKLSRVGSRIRGNDAPFGGLQLIVCGDFFQLPPVGLNDTRNRFCFESDVWKRIFPDKNVIILDQVFRQKETTFLSILHEMRRGELSYQSRQRLEAKARQYSGLAPLSFGEDNIRPTVLYSTNRDVDQINESEITKLQSAMVEFVGVDEGSNLQQLKNLKAPQLLKLKIGAQVMLLKNLDTSKGLVNGARGVVIEFCQPPRGVKSIFPKLPMVRFEVVTGDVKSVETRLMTEETFDIGSGSNMATRWQLPLMLAYAISIHKSQGMTISKLDVSFKGVFEVGQAYVALSRATTWDGLDLKNFDPACVRAHPKVKAFYSLHGYEAEKVQAGDGTVATTVVKLVQRFDRSHSTPNSVTSQPKSAGGQTVSGRDDNWLVSKRMDDGSRNSSSPYTSQTTSDIFSEFACDANGMDEWMERPLSLAALPPKSTSSISQSESGEAMEPAAPKWHAPVEHKFNMFADKPSNTTNHTGDNMSSASSGPSVPLLDRHRQNSSPHMPMPLVHPQADRARRVAPVKPVEKVLWPGTKSHANVENSAHNDNSRSQDSTPSRQLTDDQKRRIEENRQKALRLLAQNRMKNEARAESDRVLSKYGV